MNQTINPNFKEKVSTVKEKNNRELQRSKSLIWKINNYFKTTTKYKKKRDMNLVLFSPNMLLIFFGAILSLTIIIGFNSNKIQKEEVVSKKELIVSELSKSNVEENLEVIKDNETNKEVFHNFNNEFIDENKEYAVQVSRDYNIFPSVMMAQAIVESGWGSSKLASDYNNYFGIKAVDGQDFVTLETREDYGEGKQNTYIYDNFAVYTDKYKSFEANALVFENNPEFYSGVYRNNSSYYHESTVWLTKRYATDRNYYKLLDGIIESHELWRLDLM